MMTDLVAHLARFAGELRAAGVRVAIGDEVDALAALGRIDIGDAGEVRWALRCTLKIRPRDAETFDRLFVRLWRGAPPAERRPPRPVTTHGPGAPLPWPFGAADETAPPQGDRPGVTREALFRRKPFDRCDERDLHAMEPLLTRLAARLATRRSRRLRPARRGVADLRRSFRRAVATGGTPVALARRTRPVETPRLIFICDTSGSMEMHTRFLIAFARALLRVAKGTEVFAFNTELTRITPWLAAGRQDVALLRLAQAVPDWSGGTRIGESLSAFVRRHLAELVDGRTVVIIFSDGLDRGDPALLAGALRRIQTRARRVVWLNPLLGDPRYRPTAQGMAAALPFVDLFAPAHDLETLERLLPALTV